MHIIELELQTDQLVAQKVFYTTQLGLPLIAESSDSFTVAAGRSRLTFSAAEGATSPFYHVAFNIPENQFADAKAWLTARLELLKINGQDDIFFADWNAHAVYFHDPVGNIVELIARHNLPYRFTQQFDAGSILSVSEIGLPVQQVRPVLEQLGADLNLEHWRGNDSEFAAVGDEEGLFIVVSQERGWLPTGRVAQIDPVRIYIQGSQEQTVRIQGAPYEIVAVRRQPDYNETRTVPAGGNKDRDR